MLALNLFIVFGLGTFCNTVIAERCKDDGSCRQGRVHGMRSADCYNANFKKFPRCLRNDVEVVDLTYNRLRKIEKDELQRYTNLKILYLSENAIFRIEDSAFKEQESLESLDISVNALSRIPPDIFHLPSLRRLYINQNQNINFVETINEAKPITSPLEYLDISFNELEVLPDLGAMPFLTALNISGNKLLNMSTRDIAGLCNLQHLINQNFSAYFDDPCDCWNIERWLLARKVRHTSLECESSPEECSLSIKEEDMRLYEGCRVTHADVVLKSNLVKIVVPIVVAVLLLAGIAGYFLYKKKYKKIPHEVLVKTKNNVYV